MIDEEEPSPEYLKGFNHGCLMSKYEPDLLNKLLQPQSNNLPTEYSRAMQQGKEQHQREMLMAEMKAIRDKQKLTIKRKR